MTKGALWFLDLLLANWMHWTYVAQTRFGKSEFLRSWLVPAIRRRAFGLTVIDPAGPLVRKLLADIAFLGRSDDVVLVKFHEPRDPGDDRPSAPTVGFDWMTPSRASDPLVRREQNELQRERHKRRMLARRQKQDTALSPLVEEFLNPALDAWLAQNPAREPYPEYWLLYVYEPWSPEQREIVSRCTSPRIAAKILSVNDMAPKVRRDNVGPALRVLQGFYGKTAVLKHTGATYDFDAWVDAGKITLVDSSGLDDDTAVVMEQAITQKLFDKAARGLKALHRLVIDEGQRRLDVNACQQLREAAKRGLALDFGFQDAVSVPPELRSVVFGNSFHWWGRQASPEGAEYAAQDHGTRILDYTLVWYTETRYRQVHGGFDTIATESVTERDGLEYSTTKGTQRVARYDQAAETVEHRKRYEDQLKDVKRELMNAGRGWFHLAHEAATREMRYEPLLPEPFASAPTWRARMVAEAVARIRSKPWYRIPQLIEPPCEPTSPPPASAHPTDAAATLPAEDVEPS